MSFKKILIICIAILIYPANAETITHNGVSYETVTSPYTGQIWLDRNLGAESVCSDKYDVSCKGWLYQWGRDHDGHQEIYSDTVNIEDIPGYVDTVGIENRFITATSFYFNKINRHDWLPEGVDDDGSIRIRKWNKVDGSSICPKGFRVPLYSELKLEYLPLHGTGPWGINHFLKLNRVYQRERDFRYGNYRDDWAIDHTVWTNDFVGSTGLGDGYTLYTRSAAKGLPVRCIGDKDTIIGMNKAKEHSLEIFLASHIYDRTASDLYRTYAISYMGHTSVVMLDKYTDNPTSGFTAGIYRVISGYMSGKYIVAFGGTSAADRNSATSAALPDIVTDLNLLNFTKEDKQVEETRAFMDAVPNVASPFDLTITGHSLGGGLSQYASMYSGHNAVTVNTAPIPISEESQSHVIYSVTDIAKADYTIYLKYKDQIKNFMVPLDPLTSTLYFVEEYETNRQNDTQRIDNVINSLNSYGWFKSIKVADRYLSITGLAPIYLSIKSQLIKDLAYLFGAYTNDKLDDSKGIDSIYFYKAIIDLKYKNIQGFVDNIKLAYGIPYIIKLQNLIMGERIILPMDTPLLEAHLMQPFLDKSSNYFGLSGAESHEVTVDSNHNGLSDTAEKKLRLFSDSPNTVDTINNKAKIDLKHGEIEDIFDADIYIIKATKTGLYTFSTKGDLDTFGALYDADYRHLVSDDDISTNNYNFKFTHKLNIGETYYLKVDGFFDTGSYVLVTQLPEEKFVPISFGDGITVVMPY